MDMAEKEKKKLEEEVFLTKDKLREVLEEKIMFQNQLNHMERVEEGRLMEIEDKFEKLSNDYIYALEENKQLKKNEVEMKKVVQNLENGRDSFKD